MNFQPSLFIYSEHKSNSDIAPKLSAGFPVNSFSTSSLLSEFSPNWMHEPRHFNTVANTMAIKKKQTFDNLIAKAVTS